MFYGQSQSGGWSCRPHGRFRSFNSWSQPMTHPLLPTFPPSLSSAVHKCTWLQNKQLHLKCFWIFYFSPLQVLKYLDYAFTGVFTFEMVIKVSLSFLWVVVVYWFQAELLSRRQHLVLCQKKKSACWWLHTLTTTRANSTPLWFSSSELWLFYINLIITELLTLHIWYFVIWLVNDRLSLLTTWLLANQPIMFHTWFWLDDNDTVLD